MFFIIPFSGTMKNRSAVQKIGYIPQPEVIRFGVADQKMVTSAYLVMKVLTYFGGLGPETNAKNPPDYYGMFKILQGALVLDPYNLDGYYFLQSIIAWDANQAIAVNKILEEGMKYRNWDYMLPFFAAFNHSYFLHDFKTSAKFYQKAGELSGDSLFISIAGRYLYETKQTEQAILYLKTMVITSKKDTVKKSLQQRLDALIAVRKIELAIESYKSRHQELPETLDTLVNEGFIKSIPVDPYGGTFFIDMAGTVRTSSNLYPEKTNKAQE